MFNFSLYAWLIRCGQSSILHDTMKAFMGWVAFWPDFCQMETREALLAYT